MAMKSKRQLDDGVHRFTSIDFMKKCHGVGMGTEVAIVTDDADFNYCKAWHGMAWHGMAWHL